MATKSSRLLVSAAVAALALAAAPSAARSTDLATFQIAPQPLGTALKEFAREHGVQILFADADVAGQVTSGVAGRFTPAEALRRLLSASRLKAAQAGPDIFVVRGAGSRDAARTAAPRLLYASLQQTAPVTPGSAGQTAADAPQADADAGPVEGEEIVVSGIRSSLERAAEIKQDAVQVVDSIVAQDIGRFPDPTVAAALQRVPGVQVQVDRNNELGGVRIRGLTDILTTVDGREVFTATGRNFDLQDLPAEALARVDVFKSQTADMVEGGVAGAIDLKLNKPFNFREPTFILSARQNYGSVVGRSGPLLGALATARADTGIGEIGVLLNGTYSKAFSSRPASNLTDRRDSAAAPLNTPGFLLPNVVQNMPDTGTIKRKQVNAALQWQAAPELEVYVDGLYTDLYTDTSFAGFNVQPFTSNVRVASIEGTDECFQARVTAQGQNPAIITNPTNGRRELQPFTVRSVCNFARATLINPVINQNSNSIVVGQTNKLIAGGFRFEQDRARLVADIGYQTSVSTNDAVNAEVGQRVPNATIEEDFENGPRLIVGEQYPLLRDNLSLRNQFIQNFSRTEGSLFQARADGEYEFEGVLQKLQVGLRYAEREAVNRQVIENTPVPFGNIGTPSEARARLVSTLPLPPDFLTIVGYAPRLNGGSPFLGVNPAFLRSEEGRNAIRAVFNRPPGRPDFEPTRQFDAAEKTLASYLQASYEFDLGSDITLDGVLGVRATKTDRTISTFNRVAGVVSPTTAETSDTDILPNATARLQLPGGFQSRFSYSKAIRRPDFGSLNPSLALTLVNNVFLQNTGNAGNPDLRPQKSDSFDATLEYYADNAFIAVTGYYRTIVDRVLTAAELEVIDGLEYQVSRPRNLGQAELKGVEVSGQYFFDTLPGALSGFGVSGSFTYADSEVQGDDPLAGQPLGGVSKYNYTAGLLYEKFGLSGRLVYTYRSRYWTGDVTGSVQVRPIDPERVDEVFVPTLLNYIRPAGRLDFSVGYDVTDRFRIDVGGINVLRTETKSYRGLNYLNNLVLQDETTYTIGVRVRL